MKIDNQDIIRTARQLRDEENQQLHVGPWNRRRSHFHVPTWLVAIPAAAIIGFVLGLWTQDSKQGNESLTALVDTVYIKVPTPQPSQDSIAQAVLCEQNVTEDKAPSAQKHSVSRRPAPNSQQPAVGRPVADDHIRYDLLVRN